MLSEGPWAFDRRILLLKPMTGMEVLSDVQFTTTHFWVMAYDALGKKQTISFARLLASHNGEFVSCDKAMMFGVDKALCFRVYIDVSKPLRCGVNVAILGQLIWISSRSLDSLIFSMVVADSGISQGVLIPSM